MTRDCIRRHLRVKVNETKKKGEGVEKRGSALAAVVVMDEYFTAWGISKHA